MGVLTATWPVWADDLQCRQKPAAVESYLQSHQGWNVLTFTDLIADDQKTWRQYRGGICPGMATARLDGTRDSYGLALLRPGSRDHPYQKFVLLVSGNGALSEHVLYEGPTSYPNVVHRDGPGRYHRWDSDKPVWIKHDTITFEQIDASATAYYLVNGKLKSLQTAD